MVETVGTVSVKLCTAQCIFCVQNTTHKQRIQFKSFLHWVERSWISKVQNTTKPSSDELQLPERQEAPRGPKQDPSAHCSGISANTNWTKLLLVGRARRSTLQDIVKEVRNIRSEVKLRTFVISALFHFTKGLFLRDTTH
jgi:biotin synthase-like enzyme